MNIGILANEGSWYFRDLQRAALLRGHCCTRLDFTRLLATVASESAVIRHIPSQRETVGLVDSMNRSSYPIDEPVELPFGQIISREDLILVRTMPPGSLEQVVFRMDLLARLEAAGTRVVNSPKSLECAVDKFLTTARLQAAGLPVPETIVCEHEEDAQKAFEWLGGDVVVKPIFGSEGRGIVRVTDRDLAHRTFRTLMRLNSVIYLQRFVDHGGFDVRILVLDGKIVGGMRRHSPSDFRTNVARAAVAEPHEPTAREIDFAIKATSTTGAFIAGVDLLYDRDGTCFVIEVNAVPGWQAFGRVTGIDVASRLIERLDCRS